MTNPIKPNRSLSPSEQLILNSVTAPMSVKQIARVASKKSGRELPASTVSAALANLCNWGLVAKETKPNMRRNVQRTIYRRVWE